MSNRLTPEENAALEKLVQWFVLMTPENKRHLKRAAKDLIRARNQREKAA